MAASSITLLLGLYVATHTIWMDVACWNALPFGDQWSEIVTGRYISLSWLFSQHIEHRIVFPRLVFLADSWLAAETNVVTYVVNFVIQAGLAVWLFLFSQKSDLPDWPGRSWRVGICLSLLLWAGQYQNFVWGFQSQFFGVILAAFATFAMVATGSDTTWLIAAIFFDVVAVYTLASGAMVPVIATGLAMTVGRSKRSVAILGLTAAILITFYLWGYHTPSVSANPLSAWRHLPGIATYMLVALGAPMANIVFLHGNVQAGIAVSGTAGLFITYVGARLAWNILRARGALPPHQAALMAFAAFLFGMLLITAAGRYVKGIESALVSRYTTPANIFWCCICLLAAARSRHHGRIPAAIMLVVLPLPLLMAATEPANVTIAESWVSLRRAATPALLAKIDDVTMLKLIYAVEPDGTLANSAAERYIPAFRAAHHSVFALKWAGWLGTPLRNHVARIDPSSCTGRANVAIKVADMPAPGYRVTGQAWLTKDGRPADRLLIVDLTNKIIGYGLGGLELATIGLADDGPSYPGADWVGEFSNAQPETMRVFVLSGSGPTACPLTSDKK
jgi:hypothetical protein